MLENSAYVRRKASVKLGTRRGWIRRSRIDRKCAWNRKCFVKDLLEGGREGVCRLRYGFLENGIAESRITISIAVSSVPPPLFVSINLQIERYSVLSYSCILLGNLRLRKFTEYMRHRKIYAGFAQKAELNEASKSNASLFL